MFNLHDNGSILNSFGLFFQIFENIPDMVYLVRRDEKGDYQYQFVNQAATKLSGIPAFEYYGESISKFLPDQSVQLIKEKYQEAIDKKTTLVYEETIKGPQITSVKNQLFLDQNWKVYETTVTPIFDEQHTCTHIFVLVRDVTHQKLREKELRQVKEHFELVWNSTADIMYTFDTDQRFIDINDAFERILKWKREEILYDPSISIIPLSEKKGFKQIVEVLKRGHSIPSHQVQCVTKDGELIDVLASYSPLLDREGNWGGGVAVYKDISEELKYLKELEISEEKYRVIAEFSSDLIKITDSNGIIQYISPSHKAIVGNDPEETLNKSILNFVYSDDVSKFRDAIIEVNTTHQVGSVEFRKVHENGEIIWFHATITPIINDHDEIDRIIFVARDITERKQYEEKLEHLALFDSLTGLPNRVQFYKRLQNEMEQASISHSTFAVMMLDLDGFKQVNDTMGHDVGDELLKSFAKRVESCIRTNDMLARIGGDEFAILMPNLENRIQATAMAKRIIGSFHKHWECVHYCFNTTCSIGIAFSPPYEHHHKILLKQADLALYRAKKEGKNNYHIFQRGIDP